MLYIEEVLARFVCMYVFMNVCMYVCKTSWTYSAQDGQKVCNIAQLLSIMRAQPVMSYHLI